MCPLSFQTKSKRQSGSRHPPACMHRQANKGFSSTDANIHDDNDDYEENHNDDGLTLTMMDSSLPTAKPRSRFLSMKTAWVATILTLVFIQLRNTPIDSYPPTDALFEPMRQDQQQQRTPPWQPKTQKPTTLSLRDLTQRNNDSHKLICPDGSTAIHDRVVHSPSTASVGSSNHSRPIPKVLHIYHPSRCVPAEYANAIQQWKTTLPGHSVFLHDDEAVRQLVDLEWPEFPHLHKLHRCIQQNPVSLRSLWLWLLMYRYGGIYAAIDSWPGPGMNEGTIKDDSTAFFFLFGKSAPSDGMFALEPKHPIAYFAIELMLATIVDIDNILEDAHRKVMDEGILVQAFRRASKSKTVSQTPLVHNDTVTRIVLTNSNDENTNTNNDVVLLSAFLNATSNERPVWGSKEQKEQRLRFLQDLETNQPSNSTIPTSSCLSFLYSLDAQSDEMTTDETDRTTTSTSGTMHGKPFRRNAPPLTELTQSNVTNITCPEPLVPIYDRVVDSATITASNGPTGRRIPRVLHVSHKSRCVAPDFADAVDRWKEALPYHSIHFHDDDAVERVFALDWPEFPHLARMRQCVQKRGAMVIDVWRLLLMYQYGGVFTDIDNWPGPNMTESAIRSDADAFFVSETRNIPCHSYFAIAPEHPIMYYTMMQVLSRLAQLRQMEAPHILFVTGPRALSWGYLRFMDDPFAQWDGIGLRGLHNKTVDRVSPEGSAVYVRRQLGGGMQDSVEGSDFDNKRHQIHAQMNISHWSDKMGSHRKDGVKGACLAHLYGLDLKEYNS